MPVEPLKGKNKSQKEKRSTRSKHSIFGLAFDRNRVAEELGFTSDGPVVRLVGLQAEAEMPQGGQVLCA